MRTAGRQNDSWLLSAPFKFSKRTAGETTEFGRSGVELLGVIGAARLECSEPAAEPRQLIRRELGNGFGDFFDFHVPQYSSRRGLVEVRKGIGHSDKGGYVLKDGEQMRLARAIFAVLCLGMGAAFALGALANALLQASFYPLDVAVPGFFSAFFLLSGYLLLRRPPKL
jgi:hypothetical protein